MKQMEYSAEPKREVLDTGYCLGLLYYIMNLGTHPTAYIKVPDNLNINEIDLNVNGGCTYDGNGICISENEKIEGHFIGWDYAHYRDYMGIEEMLPVNLRTGGKKWTTEEIFKEVKEACYQVQTKIKEKLN